MHVYIGCKNAAQINKKIGEIFVIQYYGRLKEFYDFNKLAKFIYLIILERCYFIMKFLWRNCEINIPDISFNKRDLN